MGTNKVELKKLASQFFKNKVRVLVSITLCTIFLCHSLGKINIGIINRLEMIAYDAHLRLTVPNNKSSDIVIIDIDEASLTAEGRWPWSRNKIASLVETLFDHYQINMLGFDIVFAEPDSSSGLPILENLAKTTFKSSQEFASGLAGLRQTLNYDQIFADVIARYPIVLGIYFNSTDLDAQKIGVLPQPLMDSKKLNSSEGFVLEASGYGANLDIFTESALGAGHFSQKSDSDGVVRRQPMLINYKGNIYPSLSLEIIRRIMGSGEVQPLFATSGSGYNSLEGLLIEGLKIPIDFEGNTLIPFRGGPGSFDYVSATDVLNKTIDSISLKNKLVIVGTTAPGLFDMRATPVSETYPGVEIHASLVSGLLNQRGLQQPEYVVGYEVLVLLIAGIVMTISGALLSPFHASLFGILLIANIIGLSHLGWSNGVVLPVASGILMVILIFMLNMSYGYFVESRGKKAITGLFGQYVPPELVNEMSEAPNKYTQRAESKELTVLFSDVRGFTSISEGLAPGDLSDLMNEYLTPMTGVIHQSRGTIDKYMGDAIMAFWGAPLGDEGHVENALSAAREMLVKLDEINEKFQKKGWPTLQIGIGIHTGEMSVGNMGSTFRMAYTVLGDNVNLTSRLEALTKQYGVTCMVSEDVVRRHQEGYFREIDRVRVKGKENPVSIFELMDDRLGEALIKREIALNDEALEAYRKLDWDLAEKIYQDLLKLARSPYKYTIFLDRIEDFRKNPPKLEWEGVFNHLAK